MVDRATPWRRVTVPGRYGEGDRVVEICSGTALRERSGPKAKCRAELWYE
jgi:hypothetical protein